MWAKVQKLWIVTGEKKKNKKKRIHIRVVSYYFSEHLISTRCVSCLTGPKLHPWMKEKLLRHTKNTQYFVKKNKIHFYLYNQYFRTHNLFKNKQNSNKKTKFAWFKAPLGQKWIIPHSHT